jgi:predicted enzyme related to lactoylglutathione lyase
VSSAAGNDAAIALVVNIDVEDLGGAIRFYEEAVGLRLKRRLFEGTVAELGGAAAPVFLLQKAAGSLPSRSLAEVRSYRRHWTPVHLDFVVAALEPAVERAVQAGAKPEGPIQSFAWGRQALMSDPFGNGFCLLQWIGRGYDGVAS